MRNLFLVSRYWTKPLSALSTVSGSTAVLTQAVNGSDTDGNKFNPTSVIHIISCCKRNVTDESHEKEDVVRGEAFLHACLYSSQREFDFVNTNLMEDSIWLQTAVSLVCTHSFLVYIIRGQNGHYWQWLNVIMSYCADICPPSLDFLWRISAAQSCVCMLFVPTSSWRMDICFTLLGTSKTCLMKGYHKKQYWSSNILIGHGQNTPGSVFTDLLLLRGVYFHYIGEGYRAGSREVAC